MSIVQHSDTTLALDTDQTAWTPSQRAALAHIGVENASEGDLEVFFHVCKRTGLDPFARQIHMVGRNTKDPRTDRWVTKFTIQTGIDGFRLIGRRAADRAGQSISVEAPHWAHEDGSWRDVWSPRWGAPIAARVTLRRGGEPFTAVALFDEYKQTRGRDGGLTSMWAQRPAGQLAKCAEALAWRMAFPQDLSGLHSDDEMDQADRPHRPDRPVTTLGAALNETVGAAVNEAVQHGQRVTTPAATEQPAEAPDEQPQDVAGSPPLDVRSPLAKAMYASIHEAGILEADRISYCAEQIKRPILSTKEMTEAEARIVLDSLPKQVTAEDAFPPDPSTE